MSRIFVPADGVTDWRRLLAQPKRHWRTGYSAKAIAHCWQEADDLPPEIVRMFADSSIPAFHEIELLLAFPEYKVPLPGGKKASQNDVFVLAKTSDGQLIAMMVEAKVAESFGPILGKWNAAASPGKSARLAYIKDLLCLRGELPSTIRYQLLHRAASAMIEAERFNAQRAVVLVHSFSPDDAGFRDYEAFLALFGARAAPGELVLLHEYTGSELHAGWVRGDLRFLAV